MTAFQGISTISLPAASSDLAGRLYRACAINSNGQVGVANLHYLAIIGIIAEDPGTIEAGEDVLVHDIAAGGIGAVEVENAVSAGQILHVASSSGVANRGRVNGVDGINGLPADTMGIGVALESASAAGEVIMFLAQPIFGPHT